MSVSILSNAFTWACSAVGFGAEEEAAQPVQEQGEESNLPRIIPLSPVNGRPTISVNQVVPADQTVQELRAEVQGLLNEVRGLRNRVVLLDGSGFHSPIPDFQADLMPTWKKLCRFAIKFFVSTLIFTGTTMLGITLGGVLGGAIGAGMGAVGGPVGSVGLGVAGALMGIAIGTAIGISGALPIHNWVMRAIDNWFQAGLPHYELNINSVEQPPHDDSISPSRGGLRQDNN